MFGLALVWHIAMHRSSLVARTRPISFFLCVSVLFTEDAVPLSLILSVVVKVSCPHTFTVLLLDGVVL